jgi:nitrate/nitrite transport system substrate-binding protein
MAQMYRWQQLTQVTSLNNVAEQVYRQDLYYQALGLEVERDDSWRLSTQEESEWLDAIACGKIRLHPEGILKGFSE